MNEERKIKDLLEILELENIELKQKQIINKNFIPQQDNFYDYYNYIHKNKIKEKIDELICKERTSKLEMGNLYRYGIAVLNSVLEEN